MDARLRLTFICGACLGLAVGFAAGHVSLWRRVSQLPETRVVSSIPMTFDYSVSAGVGPGATAVDSTSSLQDSRMLASGGGVVLNDPNLGDEPVHADAIVELPAMVADAQMATFDPISSLGAPEAFPECEATPLRQAQSVEEQAVTSDASQTVAEPGGQGKLESHHRPELDPEVVEMLKDELEGVSDQQREVWADALQGMNPADAAGVILMWKKFGQGKTNPSHLSAPPPLFRSSHPDAAPAPLGPPGELRPLSEPDASSDDLGLRIDQHNLANRETCGFLELIPLQQEVPFDEASHDGPHVRVIGYRLDTQPGMHVKTGNPSHVAVQRGGFFAVTLPSGEERYTRVGRLVLDAERRLCIDLGDQDLPIAPEVQLPAGATRILVQSGQLRVEVIGQEEPTEVGPLQVVEFFDASRLRPVGNAMYESTVASGTPKRVPAELIMESLEFPLIEAPSRMAGR